MCHKSVCTVEIERGGREGGRQGVHPHNIESPSWERYSIITYLGAFCESVSFLKGGVGDDLGSREEEGLQHTPVGKAEAVQLLHEGDRVGLSSRRRENKASTGGNNQKGEP